MFFPSCSANASSRFTSRFFRPVPRTQIRGFHHVFSVLFREREFAVSIMFFLSCSANASSRFPPRFFCPVPRTQVRGFRRVFSVLFRARKFAVFSVQFRECRLRSGSRRKDNYLANLTPSSNAFWQSSCRKTVSWRSCLASASHEAIW